MADTGIQHEGRIASLETKMDRALPLIEDLHADMMGRKARWAFLTSSAKYGMWLFAGVVTLLGASKSASFAGWLQAFPH